jgi:hypothetical protein
LGASVTFWEATAPVKLPACHGPDTGSRRRLEIKSSKAGIPPATPPNLAARLRSLPAILYMLDPIPVASYSKAPRGLSVLPRVTCIFTGTSVSPSAWPRQRPTRYAIRAGRNLPDKEFRYLRTVIVTAAVYRGFNSGLAPLLLTFRHRAGVSPYTSACALAETCVFSKQSVGPFLCGPRQLTAQGRSPPGAPLLPKLRGHFAEFLSHASLDRLGILFPPTCVGLRYGHRRSR